ncbi:MAG: stage V sporulation protein B [Thermicanus sp.]|nr:stage V sporulation protein B [Thermicanus sp.]
MARQTFFQGAFILLAAGIINRLLGFIPKAILPRTIGTEGIGLYQMVFPLFIFFLTIARFGLNVSISKVVAEAYAVGDTRKIRLSLIIATLMVLAISLLLIPVLLFGSGWMARFFFTDERVFYPLLSMIPAIPIIALSTILRGYFQGVQNMTPPALSSVLESFIRILSMILLSYYLLPYGLGQAAMGLMIGMTLGELASLIYLLSRFRKARRILFTSSFPHLSRNGKELKSTFFELWRISLPVTASGLVGSFSYAAEPILVAQSLGLAGIGAATATALYGELSGLAMFLIWFPTTLTYSLSVSLVPAVAEAYAQKKEEQIGMRLNQALRLTFLLTTPFILFFLLFAQQLTDFLFGAPQVGILLQVVAPFAPFLYVQGPLAAALQGLNMARASFYNSLYGAIVKSLLILLLASRPELNIAGVALAINVGMMLVTLLHFFSLRNRIEWKIPWKPYFRILSAILGTGAVSPSLSAFLHRHLPEKGALPLTLLIAFLIYLLLLFLVRGIEKRDLRRLPWIGKWFKE